MSEIVITAGGTREKIDDVRYIGNFSSGRLGHTIAQLYAEYTDDSVTLLAPNDTIYRFGEIEGVNHESFVTSRDLREKLLGIKTADVVFHSAAVSDYQPQQIAGKIRSDEEVLSVSMWRTPKILSELRGHYGYDTMIVGFKLLSGVHDFELSQAMKDQIIANNLNACIGTDLSKIEKAPVDYRRGVKFMKTRSKTGYCPEGYDGFTLSGGVRSVASHAIGLVKNDADWIFNLDRKDEINDY